MFHNVKIVGNGNTPLYFTEFKNPSTSNVMVHINPKTIINLVSVAKPMKRPTYHVLKQKKDKLCPHIFKYSNYCRDH